MKNKKPNQKQPKLIISVFILILFGLFSGIMTHIISDDIRNGSKNFIHISDAPTICPVAPTTTTTTPSEYPFVCETYVAEDGSEVKTNDQNKLAIFLYDQQVYLSTINLIYLSKAINFIGYLISAASIISAIIIFLKQ